MKLLIKKGITSKLLRVFIQDSSVATGAGKTGLVFGGVTGYYIREGDASATSITMATMTVGTWATGGFKEIDATNMPGLYEIGIPNAAIATGSNSVVVMIKGTGIAPVVLEIQLVDIDINDTVRLGLTALPNAVAGANGGLPTGNASGQVAVQSGTGAGQLDFTSGVIKANLAQILGTALTETAGQIAAGFKQFFNIASPTSTMNTITTVTTTTTATTATNLTNAPTAGDFTAAMKTSLNAATPAVTVSDKTGFSLSAAGIQAIWDRATSLLTTVGSIGKLLVDNVDAAISSRLASGSYTAPDNTSITAIKTQTDKLTFTVANQIDANVLDWKSATAPPMTGDSFARLGAPAGASVSADVAAIKGVLPSALVSGRMDASLGAVQAGVDFSATMKTSLSAATPALSAAGNNAVADQVWDEILSGHLGVGSTGAALNAAGSSGDPWNTALPGAYGAGSAGFIVGTNLNATVSSRSTLDGTGVQAALTSQGYTTTRAGYLDTLNGLVQAIWDKATSALTTVGSIGKRLADDIDATISSRSTYAGGDTSGITTLLTRIPGTVQPQTGDSFARLGAPAGASVSADIAAIKSDTATSLSNESTINANVLTRLPTSSYVAPDNTGIALIEADTANIKTRLPAALTGAGNIKADAQVNSDKTGYALTSGERISIADSLLDRDMATGTDSGGRTVRNALRILRNKVTSNAGTLTVYKEDDTVSAWTAALTTDANADPITGVDP